MLGNMKPTGILILECSVRVLLLAGKPCGPMAGFRKWVNPGGIHRKVYGKLGAPKVRTT